MTPVNPLAQFSDPFDQGQTNDVVYNSEGDPIGTLEGVAGSIPWRRQMGEVWDSVTAGRSPVEQYEEVLNRTQHFGTLELAQYGLQTGRITETELFQSGDFLAWNQHNVARGNTFGTNELPKIIQGAILGAFGYGAAVAAGVGGAGATAAEASTAGATGAELSAAEIAAYEGGAHIGGSTATFAGTGAELSAADIAAYEGGAHLGGSTMTASSVNPLSQFGSIPGAKEVTSAVGQGLLSRLTRAVAGIGAPTTPQISPTGVQTPYAMRAPGFVSPQAIQKADQNASMIWFAVLAAIAFIIILFAKGK